MHFALSTGSLYTYSLDRVFALAAEAGFDGIVCSLIQDSMPASRSICDG